MLSTQDSPKTKRRAYLIWTHPRADSLTAQVVAGIKQELQQHDVEVAELDLYRHGFNPVLDVADEPDWGNPDKRYSEEVMELAAALQGSDFGIVVFPLWWYGMPAMLKGYLDRVWNYGLTYGAGRTLPFSKLRWITLVGGGQQEFEGWGNPDNMRHLLNGSIAAYGGVKDAEIEFMYNTIGPEEGSDAADHYAALIAQARAAMVRMLEPAIVPA
ncbi:NAD(P)H oxidoreductase [Janthinobacterium sp.]|uniref:NAD(P)H oxidoreductase n=1 Tax=Janthinobacterium sp. TaxID=1871054 RepID=UPI002619EAB0|nr:NAD(P)H oxidoreductase [Janthinobacterium sp.]